MLEVWEQPRSCLSPPERDTVLSLLLSLLQPCWVAFFILFFFSFDIAASEEPLVPAQDTY